MMKATGKITKTEGKNPLKITINGITYSVWRADLKELCKIDSIVTLEYHETKRDNTTFKNVDDVKEEKKEPITEQLHRTPDEINREVALREGLNTALASSLKPEESLDDRVLEIAKKYFEFLKKG